MTVLECCGVHDRLSELMFSYLLLFPNICRGRLRIFSCCTKIRSRINDASGDTRRHRIFCASLRW